MYQLTATTSVIRLADNAIVPADPKNRDWQEYQQWLALGNTPDPAPTPEVVMPKSVTMRQARLLMHGMEYSPGVTLLQAVEAAIEALPEPPRIAARIEWDYSNELLRNNAFVGQLAAILGLTSEQLDQMFLAAAQL